MKIPRRRMSRAVVACLAVGGSLVVLVAAGVFAIHSTIIQLDHDSANAETPTASEELQNVVNTSVGDYGTKVGVVVSDLSSGATASQNADQKFVSASLYKLFVAYGVYRQIDAGTLTYGTKLTSNGSNKTVAQCLDLMITISDNECGKALGVRLGWAKLDTLLQGEGYKNTLMNNYYSDGSFNGDKMTTASDVALLLKRLYDGTLVSTSSTQQFITLLKADEINTYLPSGLPAGTVIAHKIGYIYGYVHDAGIIYGTNKNVLVVMLSGEWSSPTATAPGVFAKLSGNVWKWMEAE